MNYVAARSIGDSRLDYATCQAAARRGKLEGARQGVRAHVPSLVIVACCCRLLLLLLLLLLALLSAGRSHGGLSRQADKGRLRGGAQSAEPARAAAHVRVPVNVVSSTNCVPQSDGRIQRGRAARATYERSS